MASRIWAISAAWVFIPGRYACPGWEWVPSIAIAWGRMLAGCSLHVFDECHGGYSCLQREGTNNMTKRRSVHMHMFMRGYVC